MRLLTRFITILVRICDQIAVLVFRVQELLTGILAVLLARIIHEGSQQKRS